MDEVLTRFLHNAGREAAELNRRSDVVRLAPVSPDPVETYCCEFRLRYLRPNGSGDIEVAPGPILALIRFPLDYLCPVGPPLGLRVVALLTADVLHPNVRGPYVCLGGGFRPATALSVLVMEMYDVLSYRNYTLDHNALNPAAAEVLRGRPGLLAGLQAPALFPRKSGSPLRIEVTPA